MIKSIVFLVAALVIIGVNVNATTISFEVRNINSGVDKTSYADSWSEQTANSKQQTANSKQQIS